MAEQSNIFRFIDDIPAGLNGVWYYEPLYKVNANGALMIWQVGFDTATNEIVVVYGKYDGVLQSSRTVVTENMSGRSLHEQALLEVKQRYRLKYRNDRYRPSGEYKRLPEPMLAGKYAKGSTKLSFPVILQPKIDGSRCICNFEGETPMFTSRGNVAWSHLSPLLGDEISIFMTYLPACSLDGEIYIHGCTFSEISSILKNASKISSKFSSLRYMIFDMYTCDPMPFEVRINMLADAYNAYVRDNGPSKNFEIVESYYGNSYDDIEEMHTVNMHNGYEGTMIKKTSCGDTDGKNYTSSVYKPGRSNNILKYKDFDDSEGVVVDVDQSKGKESGCAMLVVRVTHTNSSGVPITTDIKMRPAATFSTRKMWFDNPETVIGRTITYKYQGVSEYGVPRFPVALHFRDEGE